jgi:hypothetical protein
MLVSQNLGAWGGVGGRVNVHRIIDFFDRALCRALCCALCDVVVGVAIERRGMIEAWSC